MSGITQKAGSPTRRGVRRSIAASLSAVAMALTLATPAAAAQPNHQACLGKDIRTYAQGGSAFGALVSGSLASGGVGTEIQAHLAGDIPDAVSPNSCND